MKAIADRLQSNLERIEDRVCRACDRVGRARSEVTLVAVTKTVSTEVATILTDLGVSDLGENRPQELWRKCEALPARIRWHMIGHLQRNKVEKTLPLVHLIHAVDSVRLLQAMESEAAKQRHQIDVLLEVNVSGEATKQGFEQRELLALAPKFNPLYYVQIRGLMTMAALQDAEACRPTFARLRTLRDEIRAAIGNMHSLDHLSMGMSNDFEVAIEEGATLIRLGTVLLEGIA